jgi:DNA-binding NtrC family response regulator
MDVLVVDDEKAILDWMSLVLRSMGLEPVTADSAEEALVILSNRDIGFVITDFMMPRMNGADLIREMRSRHLVIPVVVMSGVGSIDDAVNLLRLGADDFLAKPIRRDVLTVRLEQVIQKARIYEEARLFRRFVEGTEDTGHETIITRSPAMLKVLKRLPAIGRTDASALVLGPSGSGKELVARALHRLSKRAESPFVPVNCGALPEALVESTLFGHRKGAFTGADRDSIGLARAADKGTLFLDEVGDLPLNAQVKLLRFLQSKEITPVGDSRSIKVDVRILSATHRDLKKCIAAGTFREDLYYRLNVISVELPSLDERPEDIPVLASHFLQKYVSIYGSQARAFSPEALSFLVDRHWSGNVRELENAVQRAIVACDGSVIDLSHVKPSVASDSTPLPPVVVPAALPAPVARPRVIEPVRLPEAELRPFQLAKKDAIDRFEREYLERLLRRTQRMTEAADMAGVDRKGLWRLMKKHGLREEESGQDEPDDVEPIKGEAI